jgi:hypothetical protein
VRIGEVVDTGGIPVRTDGSGKPRQTCAKDCRNLLVNEAELAEKLTARIHETVLESCKFAIGERRSTEVECCTRSGPEYRKFANLPALQHKIAASLITFAAAVLIFARGSDNALWHFGFQFD